MTIAVVKAFSVLPAGERIVTSTSVHVEIRMIQVDTCIKDPSNIRASVVHTTIYFGDAPRSFLGATAAASSSPVWLSSIRLRCELAASEFTISFFFGDHLHVVELDYKVGLDVCNPGITLDFGTFRGSYSPRYKAVNRSAIFLFRDKFEALSDVGGCIPLQQCNFSNGLAGGAGVEAPSIFVGVENNDDIFHAFFWRWRVRPLDG